MSITKKNVISAIFLQISTIVSGFVLPRIILGLFGSDVNGLVSSINQFLNYIQLIEGGLGGVVMAALYKPLSQGDKKKISGIVNATTSFFKKIGCIYIVYLIGLSIVYPLIVNTGYRYGYSIVLILVLGMNLVVQYFFSISYKLLLNADRKVYVVNFVQASAILLNIVMMIIGSVCFKDIIVIKLFSAVVFMIQPIVFYVYVKKHYVIDRNEIPDKESLSQRWVAFGTNFAYFVHMNTDIVILTLFATLKDVSVYSVYLLVVNAIKGIVISISSAVIPSFGKSLVSDDRKDMKRIFDKYEFIIHGVSFVLFTCAVIGIVPFVKWYTRNIKDANYNQPVFAILLVLAEFIYCLRDPYVQSTSAAGMFKQVAPHAYIEASLNVGVSILLVRKYGIIGVTIGTIVAMLYRMIAQIIIINNNIIKASVAYYFLKNLIMICSFILIYIFMVYGISYEIENVFQWIIKMGITFVISLIMIALIGKKVYRKSIINILKK